MNDGYVNDLHREVREELSRVDGKCATLLAVCGLSVSLVGAALISGDVDVAGLADGLAVMFHAAVVLVLLGIALLIAALTPVTRSPQTTADDLGYFGHVAKYATLSDFRDAMAGLQHGRVDREIEQTYTLSGIVKRKYLLMTLGVGSFGAGVLLGLIVGFVTGG